jgi:type II secretory pathway component GspD/PulD (secretin)
MTFCALLCCLLMWTPLRSDEPKGKSRPPAAPAEPQSDPERRLAEMEKHLAALMKEIEGLRKNLKAQPAAPGAKAEFRVFALKNARASDAAQVLTQLFRGDRSTLSIAMDERTNSLVIRGPADDLAIAEAVLQRLDTAAPDAKKVEKSQFQIFRLKNAAAPEAAKVLQALFNADPNKTLRIVADLQTNAVLVYGPEEQLLEVQAILVRLDEAAADREKENKKRGNP